MLNQKDKSILTSFGLTGSQIKTIHRVTNGFTNLDFKKMRQIEELAIERDKKLRSKNPESGVFHYELGHFLIRKVLVNKLKKDFQLNDENAQQLNRFIGNYYKLEAVHPASEDFSVPVEELLNFTLHNPTLIIPLRSNMLNFLKSILPIRQGGVLSEPLKTDMFDKPAAIIASRETLAFSHPDDDDIEDNDIRYKIFHGDYLAYEIANANFDRMVVHEHIRTKNPKDKRLIKIRNDIAASTQVAEKYGLNLNAATHEVLIHHIGEMGDEPFDFYHSTNWPRFMERSRRAVMGDKIASGRFEKFKDLALKVKNHAVLEGIHPNVKMRY